jgi:hypothetical protein
MNNKNFWGEPDDVEPLPDWMLAETHRNPQKRKPSKSLTEAIEEALRKPPVPIVIKEPRND